MKKDYKKRYKEIKRFVNFDLDLRKKLSPAEKRRISLYYNSISSITDGNFQEYSTTNSKNFKKALNSIAAPSLPKAGLKRIPIKSDDKIKIRFDRKGNIKIKQGEYIEKTIIVLNNKRLVMDDVEQYLLNKFSKIKNKKAKNYGFDIYGNIIGAVFSSDKKLLEVFEEFVTKYVEAKPAARFSLQARDVKAPQHRHNFVYNRKTKIYECKGCAVTRKAKTKRTY